jgi:hypothetical protein
MNVFDLATQPAFARELDALRRGKPIIEVEPVPREDVTVRLR